ncbi:hypothetical protein C5745_08935 [Sphingobacterium haloxyli]|uniref:DUF4168 domain-containing protein n=2 Tax=Sphingobacterium haloxyli TaxID=2100533 RepID=A0A2S9J3W7_9SPHI|nr:hypothetical protein C5745_08935 [Sphingobacterium haloxyli]
MGVIGNNIIYMRYICRKIFEKRMKMNKNKFIMQRLKVILLAVMMMVGVGAMAQEPNLLQEPELKEDFEKDELISFIKASSKVEAIQMGVQESMANAVKEEGLTVEKFNTMAQAQENSEEGIQNESAEDQKMFNTAFEKIMKIQDDVGGDIQEAIKEEGIDIQVFEQIMYAYQNSEKVKGELDGVLLELQQEQSTQP